MARYVEAVIGEIERRGHELGSAPLGSVFFGGGTPSLLPAGQVAEILEAASRVLGLGAEAEITLEANPNTVDADRLTTWLQAGVNRLSLGAQSFDDRVLAWLGRLHSADEATCAYAMARDAGFGNVSLDLISGVPGVSLASWQNTLAAAVALAPDHLSTYGLSVEPGTVLAARVATGAVSVIEEEEDAAAYALTLRLLATAGYEHYEVSNFAQPDARCRHNWACWHGGEYMGVGASAHSYVGGVRSWNHATIDAYMAAAEHGLAVQGSEEIDDLTALRERVWLRLRTADGLCLEAPELEHLGGASRFALLRQAGLVVLEGASLRLGPKGWMVADAVGIEISDLLESLSCPGPGDNMFERRGAAAPIPGSG
jgi:oxygen-independent coproporphyrinogen III oxidase